MDTIRITYEGPAGSEGALAQHLKTAGAASVDYEASTEQRNLPEAVQYVRTVFEVAGDISIVTASARWAMRRFQGSRVEGLPDDDSEEDSPG